VPGAIPDPPDSIAVYPDLIAREQIAALNVRLTEQMASQTQANKIALDAAEKAVLKAEQASEKRFEGVNEFRQTLTDQATTFITRKEVEALLMGVNATLGRLDTGASRMDARAGTAPITLIVAVVGVFVSAVLGVAAITGHLH
jgi:hypothetical protein